MSEQAANVSLGRARGWLALVGMIVAGGGGAQIGRQQAQTSMTNESARMLIHTRDREVDNLRASGEQRFAAVEHRLDRLEDHRTDCK